MPAKWKIRTRPGSRLSGFSLIEMVIALGILVVVIAVVVQGIVQMQQRSSAESGKVDTVQQTRDFVDQMVRDIHDVGYPPGIAVSQQPGCIPGPSVPPLTPCTCVGNANVACGLVFFSPTQIRYEGDLDGTGTVYQVWMQLAAPASGNCPCILQRGVLTKAAALVPGNVPDYYTEVNGIINSGNGAGAATYPIVLPGGGSYATYGTTNVFDAYDNNGNPVGSCVGPVACSSIRSLQISANVTSSFMDSATKTFPIYSITSKARLNNVSF